MTKRNGNAVSLPSGEEYTYTGEKNPEETIQALFSEPFGGGYPKKDARRKTADTNQLKAMRARSQVSIQAFIEELDEALIRKVKALIDKTKC